MRFGRLVGRAEEILTVALVVVSGLAAMQLRLVALFLGAAAAGKYPIYAPEAGEKVETCDGISCKSIECKPPFAWKKAEEMGTCCPVCWADSVKTPEDRSWANNLSGGVGMNNNADPVLCKGVMCPPLDCPEFEQSFDGRCCTKCSK